MSEVSRHYYRTDDGRARICFELSVADAELIFDHPRKEGNPVDYLKAAAKERTQLAKLQRTASISVVVFLVLLFFLRRFIP